MSSVNTAIALENNRLTPHPQGSVRELCHVSLPLIVSFLSNSVMLFVDRLCLSHFSVDAFNGAVTGGSWFWPFQYGTLAVAAMAEVFVGQHNGAGLRSKLGEPVWQMIWFSLFTTLFFVPAFFLIHALPVDALQNDVPARDYFRFLMLFGPFFPLGTALAAFFIGRGQVRLITFCSLVANVFNLAFDIVLIFGIPGLFSPLGIKGAAIATGVAQISQCLILSVVFLKKENRLHFGTGHWRLHPSAFWQSLRVGLPNCIAHMVEIIAWIAFFRIMTQAGPEYMTVAAVDNTLLGLFYFVTSGLSKGVEAIASNFIGAKRWDLIGNLAISSLKVHIAICLCLSLALLIYPERLVELFMPVGIDPAMAASVKAIVVKSCFWVWLYYLFDGVMWILGAILTATGNTKFLMGASGLTAWFCAIVPTYYAILHYGLQADKGALFCAFYSVVTALLFLWKVRSIVKVQPVPVTDNF